MELLCVVIIVLPPLQQYQDSWFLKSDVSPSLLSVYVPVRKLTSRKDTACVPLLEVTGRLPGVRGCQFAGKKWLI